MGGFIKIVDFSEFISETDLSWTITENQGTKELFSAFLRLVHYINYKNFGYMVTTVEEPMEANEYWTFNLVWLEMFTRSHEIVEKM